MAAAAAALAVGGAVVGGVGAAANGKFGIPNRSESACTSASTPGYIWLMMQADAMLLRAASSSGTRGSGIEFATCSHNGNAGASSSCSSFPSMFFLSCVRRASRCLNARAHWIASKNSRDISHTGL